MRTGRVQGLTSNFGKTIITGIDNYIMLWGLCGMMIESCGYWGKQNDI